MVNFWTASTLSIKEAFFRFYIQFMGNYVKFIKNNLTEDKQGFSNIFNLVDYLKQTDSNNISFLTEFSKTQCFTFLIERTQKCLYTKNELSFFLEGTKLFITRGSEALDNEISKVSAKLLRNYSKVNSNN